MDWVDWDYSDLDEDESPKSSKCDHEWILTGTSPLTGETWYNCKKCDLPKEKSELS